MDDKKDNSTYLNKNEILQKEIDWLKLSMDTDKHDHAGEYNALLQNIASILILFLGILAGINLLIINYLTSLDWLHFCLINFCLILVFIIHIRNYEQKIKNKKNGINDIEKEFQRKKCLVRKRYKKMGIDVEGIQKEFEGGC